MTRNAPLQSVRLGLAALALCAAACATSPSPIATQQVDDYAHGFTASKASPLATAVELNAAKLETGVDGVLLLSGTGEGRSITARALDTKGWKDVNGIVVRAEPKLPNVKADALIAAVVDGINAKSAAVQIYGTTIAVELTDVDLPTLKAHTDRVTLFVHLYDPNSSTRGAVAANQGALNAIGTIRIGGDDAR